VQMEDRECEIVVRPEPDATQREAIEKALVQRPARSGAETRGAWWGAGVRANVAEDAMP
jgi:hypothetical protein